MSTGFRCHRVKVSTLDFTLIKNMYELLSKHFRNVDQLSFRRDLESKDDVFLLSKSDSGELVGFSTQKILYLPSKVRVVFSGDTVIDPRAWGSLELPRTWGQWMLQLQAASKFPLYWLLISKGHRTYRFLPTYFKDFAPGIKRAFTDKEREIVEQAGRRLFGDRMYLNQQGHLAVSGGLTAQTLSEELQDIKLSRRRHPQIAWFLEANPKCQIGEELICLLCFTPDNMNNFCSNMLGLNRSSVLQAIAS